MDFINSITKQHKVAYIQKKIKIKIKRRKKKKKIGNKYYDNKSGR